MYTLEFTGKEIIVYVESVSEKNQLFQSNDQVLSAMREHNIEKLKEILNSDDNGLTLCEVKILQYAITNNICGILCKLDNDNGAVDKKLSLLFSSVYLHDNELENILLKVDIDFYDEHSDDTSLKTSGSSDLKYTYNLSKELLYKACRSNNITIIDYLLNNCNIDQDGYNAALFWAKDYKNIETMKYLITNHGTKISYEELKQEVQELISGDSKDSSNETILDTLSNITSTDLEQKHLPEEVTITGDGSGEGIT